MNPIEAQEPIEVPFLRRFRNALADGTKTWTCRRHPLAKPGQLLVAYRYGPRDESPIYLRLLSVSEKRLGDVALFHFKEEGCASPEEFVAIWTELHPKAGFDPDREVWVHEFRREDAR